VISDEAGDARLGAAIGDHVATTLARVSGLRVVPRSAAAAALAATPDPVAVARTLRVRVLLEGTLQREGDRVRVAARLLDASDGSMLWADVYDGTTRELFAMQDHLARSVATAVGEELEALSGER
jgi:TolB-like protein